MHLPIRHRRCRRAAHRHHTRIRDILRKRRVGACRTRRLAQPSLVVGPGVDGLASGDAGASGGIAVEIRCGGADSWARVDAQAGAAVAVCVEVGWAERDALLAVAEEVDGGWAGTDRNAEVEIAIAVAVSAACECWPASPHTRRIISKIACRAATQTPPRGLIGKGIRRTQLGTLPIHILPIPIARGRTGIHTNPQIGISPQHGNSGTPRHTHSMPGRIIPIRRGRTNINTDPLPDHSIRIGPRRTIRHTLLCRILAEVVCWAVFVLDAFFCLVVGVVEFG